MAGMDEIVRYYSELFNEDTRLCEGLGAIELVRTQAILSRELPPPPATVLDVGGGPGRYARWLVERGYTVHLVDIVPRHVEQARRALAGTSGTWTATVGDARRLELADGSLDAVLLMGPLYHVQAREERVTILREAWRVLRPRGILCAAAISRFASLIDGLSSGFVADPSFREIVRADIATGRHVNPTADARYFTTAYLHHPTELRDELARAGLTVPVSWPSKASCGLPATRPSSPRAAQPQARSWRRCSRSRKTPASSAPAPTSWRSRQGQLRPIVRQARSPGAVGEEPELFGASAWLAGASLRKRTTLASR